MEKEKNNELLETLEWAVETGQWVRLTYLLEDGQVMTNEVAVAAINGDSLIAEIGGFGLEIKVSSIIDAKNIG